MIKSCKDIADSEEGLHYIVIAGNESVCSSDTNSDIDTLANMIAMQMEEDDVLYQAVVKGLQILNGETEDRQVTMYDCVKLFIETMDKKYPDASEDSVAFLVATDGNRISSMINGDDELIRNALCYLIIKDDGVKSIIADSLVAAFDHLNKQKDDSSVQTAQ